MPYVLHGEDVVEVGLKIEQNGRKFYTKVAELSKTADIRELFGFLAVQEQRHIEQFRAIMRSGGSYRPPEAIAEEQMAYVRALASMFVFTPDFPPEYAAVQAQTPEAAIEIGINVEKDSILFYRNVEDYVPPKEAETVRELRRQEETHLRILTEKLSLLRGKSL